MVALKRWPETLICESLALWSIKDANVVTFSQRRQRPATS
jgi:hypothetical protein